MSTAPESTTSLLAAVITQVCPVAPPGAQKYADQLMGYLLWGVGILFILGVIVGIAAIVGGRMPHASKAGVVGVVLVFVAIIAYLVLPGIVRAMTGSGCV